MTDNDKNDSSVPSAMVARLTAFTSALAGCFRLLAPLDPISRGRIVDGLLRTYRDDVALYRERSTKVIEALLREDDDAANPESPDGSEG